VSHVPLLACERDGTILLLGAVTKANQHWRSWG
jgi:predicted FMN-binding regulatory protein PaiB